MTTVKITLNNDKISDQYGNPGYISGTFTINYNDNVDPNSVVAGTLSGNYTIRYVAATPSGSYNISTSSSFAGQPLLNNGKDQNGQQAYGIAYSTSDGNLTINYVDQTPSTLGYVAASVSQGSVFLTSQNNPQDERQDPVSSMPLCFAAGTHILTKRGKVRVEELELGDFVVTASGAARVVRWLGHRELDCDRHGRPHDIYPICVAAHAFGENSPERALYLSPGHLVLVGADEDFGGGHLVPVMCLINGTTIQRVEVRRVAYWHVELDEHDILLAEGLPAESYIDLGSRHWFDGADELLHDPDFVATGMPGRCRPVAIDGPIIEAERRRLDAVFACRLTAACVWPCMEEGRPQGFIPLNGWRRAEPIAARLGCRLDG